MLHPALKRGVKELIKRMALNGYDVLITSTYRDNEYQDYLYAQGRTLKGAIVTNARGGESIHNYRLAFDIAKNIRGQEYNDQRFFDMAGAIGKEMGLDWGGDWKGMVDKPHFEFTNGLTLWRLKRGERVDENIKLKWEKVDIINKTEKTIEKMEQEISFDKAYWKKVLDGEENANPIYLKRIINRILGKEENEKDIADEKVLEYIKKYTSSVEYWRKVFKGEEVANKEYIRGLLEKLL